MINYGNGVELDTLDDGDLETIRKWRNDFSVWKWTRQNDLISEASQKRWFEAQSADPKIKMYSVRYNNRLSGVCGLTDIDHVHGRCEFSLYIAPESRGNGLGALALQTLFSHAFNTLNINSIWGETFEGNPAIKIFKKLGMITDGLRREFYFKSGKRVDAILVSILRSEWDKNNEFKKVPICSTRAIS